MHLRDACFELKVGQMHSGLHKLASKWLHISDSYVASSNDCVKLLHPLEITDNVLSTIFMGGIDFYSTVFIHGIRFTSADYAQGKVGDDSSIIFKTGLQENFGRIRRIFTVNDTGPIFYVDVFKKN
ncbi:unnamed protein product [Adineta ricciae]|uniref:Uncharacterized protein n=1 Tax=Adineta ricciae TaxID=249248 RepID=A0A815EYG9_ADIRI|nr:unnamed protein product [Adineta ricciae]CAF1332380.1 unnamed protein product [Adineta ricciae]